MESLDFATADDFEYITRFKNKQINVHTIEASEDISKPFRDKKQNQKPIEFEFHSLKSMLDDLTAWQIDINQKSKYFQIIETRPPLELSKLCKSRRIKF